LTKEEHHLSVISRERRNNDAIHCKSHNK